MPAQTVDRISEAKMDTGSAAQRASKVRTPGQLRQSSLFPSIADPYLLAIFRIAFSLVGIGYLSSYWRHLDLFSAPYPATMPYAYAACAYALLTAFIRLLGWGGQTVSLLHFLAVTWLLPRTFPHSSVNEELYLLLSFWSCFMRLDRKWALEPANNRKDSPSWPVVLLGVNMGVYLLSAGLFKAFDPAWTSGNAAYGLCCAPHMTPEIFRGLTKLDLPLRLVTHAIVCLELSWLILFFVPKLRMLSVIGIFLFFAGLIAPLRLDWIGEVGICISMALAAVTPDCSHLVKAALAKLGRKRAIDGSELATRQEPARQPEPVQKGGWRCQLAIWPLGALLLVMSWFALVQSTWGTAQQPLEQIRVELEKRCKNAYPVWLVILNAHTTSLGPKNMFTTNQLTSIGHEFIYRLQIRTKDNRAESCIDSFRADGGGGSAMHTLGEIKFAQNLMLPISTVCQRLAQHKQPDAQYLRDLDFVLEWASHQTSSAVQSVDLIAAPMTRDEILWNADELQHHRPQWQLYCRWTPERGVMPVLGRKQ